MTACPLTTGFPCNNFLRLSGLLLRESEVSDVEVAWTIEKHVCPRQGPTPSRESVE